MNKSNLICIIAFFFPSKYGSGIGEEDSSHTNTNAYENSVRLSGQKRSRDDDGDDVIIGISHKDFAKAKRNSS